MQIKETPELLVCVFPVDMTSFNTKTIAAINSVKEHLAVLMCVESHYAVCGVSLKDRIMKVSDGLDKPLQSSYHHAGHNTYAKIGVTMVMNESPA
jgi:hypothetical protein